jgi:tryptophanyl-tRNA synthetase
MNDSGNTKPETQAIFRNTTPAGGAVRGVVLSGMQPTGQLHLGNLEGALNNWIRLQSAYEMYCCIVDWHSLTADFDKTEGMQDRILQMAVDYLAAGLDPERCAIFVQSQVKEHAELHLLFSMLVPVPWLERMPTYKDKRDTLGLDSYGFLGYPVLQAADILVYRAQWVPVGKDQERHIIFARDLAGRFNHLYGQEVFPLPEALFTEFSEIPGTDGRKMSKSYGNDIRLADSPEATTDKLKRMFTGGRSCARSTSCTASIPKPRSPITCKPPAKPESWAAWSANATSRSTSMPISSRCGNDVLPSRNDPPTSGIISLRAQRAPGCEPPKPWPACATSCSWPEGAHGRNPLCRPPRSFRRTDAP